MSTSATTTNTVPDYVYTTYIRATAEQVWDALTDADLTARFWGARPGLRLAGRSRVDHVRTDGSGIPPDVSGRVIETDRPPPAGLRVR